MTEYRFKGCRHWFPNRLDELLYHSNETRVLDEGFKPTVRTFIRTLIN